MMKNIIFQYLEKNFKEEREVGLEDKHEEHWGAPRKSRE